MYTCFCCSKVIDVANHSNCLYRRNHYHEECCEICSPPSKIIVIKEKTPPPSLSPSLPKIEKAKSGPGKLNFNKLGTFEKNNEVNCKECKKKIIGQRFLTNKIGEFRCQSCNSKLEESCFVCKVSFDKINEQGKTGKVFFKDDQQNNLCARCIKIYQEEKNSKELKQEQDESKKKHLLYSKSTQFKKTVHCDRCTKKVGSEVVDFEGESLCLDCFSCYSCKTNLKYQAVFQEDKGLACVKCKSPVSSETCFDCVKNFLANEPFYRDPKNDGPLCIECYSKRNINICNQCKKAIKSSSKSLCFHNDCLKKHATND